MFNRHHIKSFMLLAALLICLNSIAHSEAKTKSGLLQPGRGGPILITSDAAESDNRNRWIEFVGNVIAKNEEVTITAQRLKIFYEPSAEASKESANKESTKIVKVIAQGNTKIVFDNATKTATAEQCIYTAADDSLVLSGGDPTVTSGKSTIHGEKISFYQKENRTVVVGSKSKQVHAEFFNDRTGTVSK